MGSPVLSAMIAMYWLTPATISFSVLLDRDGTGGEDSKVALSGDGLRDGLWEFVWVVDLHHF